MKIKFVRSVYYRLYIRWLAIKSIRNINLGDTVIHKGRERKVLNGVCEGKWTLSNPYEECVPESEFVRPMSLKNVIGSYRFAVKFYELNWLAIWVNKGIEDWVKRCRIWPNRGEYTTKR